jgi:hypothetical protein
MLAMKMPKRNSFYVLRYDLLTLSAASADDFNRKGFERNMTGENGTGTTPAH